MGLAIILILLSVFVGAFAQRVTGMGFALVSGPFLVLLIDPLAGVVLVNLCGFVSSVIVLSRTYRDVEWKTAGFLTVACVVGTIPGAFLAVAIPSHALETLIGSLVIASLAASLLLNRYSRALTRSPASIAVSGVASGVMNAAAGVGGPPLSALAVVSRWEQRAFAATIQPVFVVMAASSVAAKLLFDSGSWPELDLVTWALILGALAGGQLMGEWLSRKIPMRAARTGMLTLAFLGGILTMSRGLGFI